MLVSSALANLAGGRPALVCVGCGLINAAEAGLGSWWLSRGTPDGERPTLASLPDLARLMVAAALDATAAASLAAAVVWAAQGARPWSSWRSVAAAHAAAVLVIVPLFLQTPAGPGWRTWEAATQWALSLAAAAVVFAPGQRLPLVFLVLPALMWTALRGVRRTAAQLLDLPAAEPAAGVAQPASATRDGGATVTAVPPGVSLTSSSRWRSTATRPMAPGSCWRRWRRRERRSAARCSRRRRRPGVFGKDQFAVDVAARTVRCPAGVTTTMRPAGTGTQMATFGSACASCPLAAQCTDAKAGRTISIGPHEERLTRVRTAQRDPAWQRTTGRPARKWNARSVT